MRLMEILPEYEVQRFNRPPLLTKDEQKLYFKVDETIKEKIQSMKKPENQIGFLLQYGYFKFSGKFFIDKLFNCVR